MSFHQDTFHQGAVDIDKYEYQTDIEYWKIKDRKTRALAYLYQMIKLSEKYDLDQKSIRANLNQLYKMIREI